MKKTKENQLNEQNEKPWYDGFGSLEFYNLESHKYKFASTLQALMVIIHN